MALALALQVAESNDNKTITLTDISNWGDTNPLVTDIDGITHTLSLNITVTTSSGIETTYETIDLYTLFGPFSDVDDLVFTLDSTLLISGTTPLGTEDTEFPDGIYTFEYMYDEGLFTEEVLEEKVLIEGRVRNAIYELYRTIPVTYNCQDCKSKKILDIIFTKAYYDAMVMSAYVARERELLNMLSVIERLITNGSSYTW